MQNHSNSKLPRWLVIFILTVFTVHYSVILVNHFSKKILPKRLYYATNSYLVPWFFQNLTAFAPDPPINRHVFVYRTLTNDTWSGWKYPAYHYLSKQWKNRFDVATKTHDQIELVGDHLYITANRYPGNGIYKSSNGATLPAVVSAKKVIELRRDDVSQIDSFQVAIYIQRVRSIDGRTVKTDSALFYPKFGWND